MMLEVFIMCIDICNLQVLVIKLAFQKTHEFYDKVTSYFLFILNRKIKDILAYLMNFHLVNIRRYKKLNL